jgi:hypothetical protein
MIIAQISLMCSLNVQNGHHGPEILIFFEFFWKKQVVLCYICFRICIYLANTISLLF